MPAIWVGISERNAIGLFDARSLLDMGLESRRVHLMYLSHGTVPFGLLTILHLKEVKVLLGKGRNSKAFTLG